MKKLSLLCLKLLVDSYLFGIKLNLCDTVVNSWVYCAEYAKNIVLKENYLVIQETEFSRHLHKILP